MNSVMHFEVPADDVERAQKFYSEVFGWQMDPIPAMKYTIVRTAETDEKTHMLKSPGAINGGIMKKNADIKNPVITIVTKDMDASAKMIESHGGKIIVPKIKVGDMGLSLYFKDSEGNLMGLWQPLGKI